MKTPVSVLYLENMPILEQLRLEEALLRTATGNYCLINMGSPKAIIMGISSKLEEMVELERLKKAPIPVIKRFSGGGTVVADENTVFVTFIGQKEMLPCPLFPEPILRWTEAFYKPIFGALPFSLQENDYTLKDQKIGGNAQYLRKDRWLHHTSFLWSFTEENMAYLKMPKKRPDYRRSREHGSFLTSLDRIFPSKEAFIEQIQKKLFKDFDLQELSLEDVVEYLDKAHRKATMLLSSPH